MIYDNVGDIIDPLKQDLALEFFKKEKKKQNNNTNNSSILTEININHDQIDHHIYKK